MSGKFDLEQEMLPAWTKAAALIRRLGGRITAREFGRHSWMFRGCPRSMLQTMVERGYGRWEDKRRGAKGGRPTRIFVLSEQSNESAASPNALAAPSPHGGLPVSPHAGFPASPALVSQPIEPVVAVGAGDANNTSSLDGEVSS